jgi:hypothetical protein
MDEDFCKEQTQRIRALADRADLLHQAMPVGAGRPYAPGVASPLKAAERPLPVRVTPPASILSGWARRDQGRDRSLVRRLRRRRIPARAGVRAGRRTYPGRGVKARAVCRPSRVRCGSHLRELDMATMN